MNERAKRRVSDYRKAYATTLRDVYSSWSDKKEKAYKRCLRLKEDMNGYNFRIIKASSWQFSCGFLYRDGDGIEHLMYITKGEDNDIRLDEEE